MTEVRVARQPQIDSLLAAVLAAAVVADYDSEADYSAAAARSCPVR